jgi:hypothetical protein
MHNPEPDKIKEDLRNAFESLSSMNFDALVQQALAESTKRLKSVTKTYNRINRWHRVYIFISGSRSKEEFAYFLARLPAWAVYGRSNRDIKHQIRRPPGAKLLDLVDFLFPLKTVERTFKPFIADWQYEYFEALKQSRTKKARWISIRYRFAFACTFIKAMGLSKMFSLFKQISK